MNLFSFPVECERCGEVAPGPLRYATANWDPHLRVVHRNRRICDDNLIAAERKKKAS